MANRRIYANSKLSKRNTNTPKLTGGGAHRGTTLYLRRDEIRAMRRENTVVRLDNKQRHTNETFKDYIANLNK